MGDSTKTNVAPAVVKTTVIHPSLDSSSDSDGPGDSNGLTIENVLAGINAKFPSHDFLKFRAQLIDNGIHYLITASLFNKQFYCENVGMTHGEAVLFCEWVQKELRKFRKVKEKRRVKGKKRAQMNHDSDENIQ